MKRLMTFLLLAGSLSLAAGAQATGTLHVKVTLRARADVAHITARLAGREVATRNVTGSGAVDLEVPRGKALLVTVTADGYDDMQRTVKVHAETTEVFALALQPRVVVTAPPGTRVVLDGRSLGSTADTDFLIRPPALEAGHTYTLTLDGKQGRQTFRFTALPGAGHVVIGKSSEKVRGISIGSKDYQIYPPPRK
jgi:hypothetical protein